MTVKEYELNIAELQSIQETLGYEEERNILQPNGHRVTITMNNIVVTDSEGNEIYSH